ncbi:MAG TPA: winged helix-turn-helix domain-containing protein [Candidatus Sulfotelmatobacter sp.]|nr:winged helix-turn-helix domain-containing protein [Candidatus Sulfotelmatobacter sp.]
MKRLIEFGPFRVDPDKELLLRGDETVPLTPKTFQILLVLVRHSKEVVTKDDLMKMVWPDTFVEEANLSRNIFLLRKALGETPQDHQYIVTVPGRGYRFAEDVKLIPGPELNVVAASHTKLQVQVNESRPWGWIAAAVVLVVAVAVGSFRLLYHPSPALGAKDTLVIADFANSAGDPVFDGTLRQGLSVQLEQSPFLRLVSDERIHKTLRLMDQPTDTHLTPDLAREVCERTGSAAVLNGSITTLGNQYVLGLKVVNCQTGEVLDEEQVQAARKEEVLRALDQIARKFRSRVGESLTSVGQHNTPLAEATTSSLDALKAYSRGWQLLYSDPPAAIPFFAQAVEIDPQFAMAHAALGLMYGHTGESALAAAQTGIAYELRDHASEPEKYFISAYYEGRTTGNQEKAQQICQSWSRSYPREVTPHDFLSGFVYTGLGKYERAVEEAQKSIELDPDGAIAYVNLADDYQYLNRLAEAEAVLKKAEDRKLEMPDFLVLRYDLAFLKSDDSEMARVVSLSQRDSEAEDWLLHHQSFVLAYSGRLRDARKMSLQAAALAQQAGHAERAALFEAGAALREAFFGNATAVRQRTAVALALAKDREVEYGAALALTLSGSSSQAEALADDLEKNFPEDTSVRFSYLPVLRATLALNRRQPSKAIEVLESAAPYELGTPRSNLQGFFGALYPVYLRGQAYLSAHQGAEAAAEFQKILDHRGVLVSDPVGALARLQLARSFALSGDMAKAKAAYQDFLTLWKDADPDIPALKQAKVEFAKLQ